VGQVIEYPDGSWMWTYQTSPDDVSQDVEITVTDGEGLNSVAVFQITILPPMDPGTPSPSIADAPPAVLWQDPGQRLANDPGADDSNERDLISEIFADDSQWW
jgi:hypothetical protein